MELTTAFPVLQRGQAISKNKHVYFKTIVDFCDTILVCDGDICPTLKR